MTTTTATTAPPPRIDLTETEETVRRLLVDVGAEIDTYNRTTGARNKDPIVLRFTGGWVRDKLLGIPSHDIDVGISRMTGYNFGLYLAGFLKRHYHSYGIAAGAVHRIESNPEKSKHLETATMKILGLDVDLVNLRSEVYKGDSRVPIMEFGTPTEDALRRDCTVNALFYNLHTRRVEDFTEHGLDDMKNKIIRTPLPPQETFDDDPLRILRLIRFSSRLGFDIVPEASQAMMLPEIQDALRHKISRERVGDELTKMLLGPSPYTSLLLIHTHALYTSIFAPPDIPLPPLPLHLVPSALSIAKHLHTLPSHSPLIPTPHDIHVSWLLAALVPWNGLILDTKKQTPAAATVVREGLKVHKVADAIAKAGRQEPVVREMAAKEEGEWTRGVVGRFVVALGAVWRSCLWGAEVEELVKVWPEGAEEPSPECEAIIKRYAALTARITELGMEEAYLVKPLINGNDLLGLLARPRGPWLSKALPKIVDWQWSNPEAGKDEVMEWAKANKDLLLK